MPNTSLKNIIWAYRVHIESYSPSPSFENLRMNNYFINEPDPGD